MPLFLVRKGLSMNENKMSGAGRARQSLATSNTNWPRATRCRLRAARGGYELKTSAAFNRSAFGVGLCLTGRSRGRLHVRIAPAKPSAAPLN
jgi:hypothetical protein